MSDALPHFLLSSHFLRLAENASARLVGTHNSLWVVSGKDISPEEYFRKTKCSDHSVGVAILFNFYHGIELVLKAALVQRGEKKLVHTLTALLDRFEQHYPDSDLIKSLSPHVRTVDPGSPVGRFLASNNVPIDTWYQAFKYPSLKSGKQLTHWTLQYGGGGTVAYWRGIKSSASKIRKQAVALWRAETDA
jgi:hypothetical protein